MTRQTIPSLTGLRFIAALSVALGHATPFLMPFQGPVPAWYVGLESLSGIGMPLFFVLSGFVIHYNYSDSIKRERQRGILNFFIARFARVYPLFAVCLAYDVIFSYTYSQLPATAGQALPYYLSMTQTWWYRVIGSHSLVYQFGVMPSVAWSIATEWFFYCAYPLICVGLARVRTLRGTCTAAAILSLTAVALLTAVATHLGAINQLAVSHFGPVASTSTHEQDSFVRWLVYFSPYSRMLEFALGCLCADAILKLQHVPVVGRERHTGMALTGVAVAAILGVFLVLYPYNNRVPLPPELVSVFGMCFGMAPPCALLIFCCARFDNVVVRLLSSTLLVECGEASYSLYMLHLMVIYAFRWESAAVTSFKVGVGDTLRLSLTVMTMVGLSFATWRTIELPARRWLRRILTVRSRTVELERSLEPVSSPGAR